MKYILIYFVKRIIDYLILTYLIYINLNIFNFIDFIKAINLIELQEIVGPRPSPIISELEKETQKYQEAHSMASESNLTLNKVLLAASLHNKSLGFLAKLIL